MAASSDPQPLLTQFEQAIRRDPAQRGLIGTEDTLGPLCPGHLAAAVDHLARFAQQVWIITGFYVPKGNPPAAETDGPPGAALLAAALQGCGIEVRLLTDRWCIDAVRVAAMGYGIKAEHILASPDTDAEVTQWTCELLTHPETAVVTHVVAIERVGPACRPEEWGVSSLSESFAAVVPEADWNCCHNMRGEVIDAYTPPLHRVIEEAAARRPGVRTIGIGDGGNELGMGAIPWPELRRRLAEPQASRIPCRVGTDWTIIAGVSNWGAAAVAAGVCWQKQRLDVLQPWNRSFEESQLQALVTHGPAVDGVTRLQEATVDGLPFLTYLQPWETMRLWLGLDAAPGSQKSV